MNTLFRRSLSVTGSVPAADARLRFEQLCAVHRADVFRFLFWLCRDRSLAEDVMQETLLRAWRSMDSLSDLSAARAWLLTIARRELARTFERKRLPTVDIDAVCAAEDESLGIEETHELQDVRRAILELDDTHREPLVMQVLLGYTTEEIAQALEISVPAVLTRLCRARQQLRDRLQIGEQPGRGEKR